MDLLQAIILGVVQGLTEFIPVSSTAHLVFASRWTDLHNGDPKAITATMAVIQLGTLAAVFVYFRDDIAAIVRAFVGDHLRYFSKGREGGPALSQQARLGWLIVLGSIPIGVAGLLFKDVIEGAFTKNLWVIATTMIAIALLLGIAEVVGTKRRGIESFGVRDAVVVGFAQALALIPGASRSGSTIMGGLFAGQRREDAARFSFLLMIPAISASGLLELKEAVSVLSADDMFALGVGTAVAGVVGYLSIWFLLSFLRKNSTAVFIAYRVIVGTAILLLLWLGVIDPSVNGV
jgi:undecaprenyl-diphosphatase